MSELSEKELLILSNMSYINEVVEYRSIDDFVSSVKDENGNISEKKVSKLTASGGLGTKECVGIFEAADACGGDFKNVTLERTINDGGIRGLCYVDSNNSATVVFRGTGGTYTAWKDNFEGEYLEDTKLQKLAADFVRYDCGVYNDVTVTGHSKGGNMAQYTTIVCGDKVKRCVSFDGQGVGKECSLKYRDEIALASPKIKSICADNDYVNIMLNNIAGEAEYVRNPVDSIPDCHSPYALLKNAEFDSKGKIVNCTDQTEDMKKLSMCGLALTFLLDRLDNDGNRKYVDALGRTFAGAISSEFSDENVRKDILKSYTNFGNYVLESVGLASLMEDSGVNIQVESEYVDFDRMREVIESLDEIKENMASVNESLRNLVSKCQFFIVTELVLDSVLLAESFKIEEDIRMVECYKEKLELILELYMRREKDLCNLYVDSV